MTKPIEMPKSTTGYGYVGTWRNMDIGWCLPEFVDQDNVKANPVQPSDRWEIRAPKGDRAFLCRITVEPVQDAKGRLITRVKR